MTKVWSKNVEQQALRKGRKANLLEQKGTGWMLMMQVDYIPA
jgi:hypothetical protein